MLRLYPQITFTKKNGSQYIFPFVTECETEESYENLTDMFKITMPRNLKIQDKPLFSGASPIFERGDRVRVELGYFPTLRNVFEGWISDIGAKIPVEITCEDDMWLLKNTNITYPSKKYIQLVYLSKKNGKPRKRPKVISPSITLKQLLDNILPADIEYAEPVLDVTLGQFRVSNASVSEVLAKIKSEYGLFSYFRSGLLYVGLASNAKDTAIQEFEFENTIIDDSDLQYQLAKDISIKVVAKLMGLNNTFEEVEVGDTDGAQRSVFMYWDGKGIKPNLKEFATLKLNEAKYDGYQGSFETFGEPYVRHGDIARLTSKKLPERNGDYLIVSVKRTFGMGGYRQFIELGAKVG